MQDREPSTFESNWSGSVVAGQWREQSTSLWNFLKTDRDDVLMVREPFGDRTRTALLVAAAVVASFGLGWAGGLSTKHPRRELPKPDRAARWKARERRHPRQIRPPLSEALPSHPPCYPPVHVCLRTRPPRRMRALPPLRSRYGSPWWRRRKPSRRRFPVGRSSMSGTAPPFSKALTGFGWPHAATAFPV
jgi:hypothetical protein